MSDFMDIGFYRYSLLNRGGDRMVVDYANHLVALGHRVRFYLKEIDTVFRVDPKIEITKISCQNRCGFLWQGMRHCFGHDFLVVDIIHLAPFLKFKNRIVYFAQADDIEYYDSPLIRRIIDFLYRWYFSKNGPVITVSQHLSDIFLKRYHFDHSHVVTNGINLSIFYPDSDPDLLSLKETRRALLFMARGDHYRKGYDLALEIFSRLNDNHINNIELWVCGESISDRDYCFPVRNFGVVDDARLRRILSSADIFFYPSRHEGFGLFPLEAMACGCVAVTTKAIPYFSSLESIQVASIEDVDSLYHLIVKLIQDNIRFEKLRNKSKTDASHYDLQKSKELFSQTLESLHSKCLI